VAEELHFGRAAQRLHLAGPSLSQQIKALETDLGVALFNRDRRSVALTGTGAALLPRVRELLHQAEELRRAAGGVSATEPLRLGYVAWLPEDLAPRVGGIAKVHLDTWVLPSHAQARRVAEHGLDLAVCWVSADDLTDLALQAQAVGTQPIRAVAPAGDSSDVEAGEVVVLVDADIAGWNSWNLYAGQFAAAVGAPVVEITDGGISGPAFFEHVRRLHRPVLASPKVSAPLPPDLVVRTVVDPAPYWTWFLVARQDETRPAVLQILHTLAVDTGPLQADSNVWILPPGRGAHRTG
jgi:DNA-binding transcriptional LysR family regulator